MVQKVGPEQARELIDGGHLDVVDVREIGEWSQGHLPGARHVPLSSLRSNLKRELPRDGVIFVCAAGVRSEAACRLALAQGYTAVYNLTGGTRAWDRAGLPLVEELVQKSA